MSSVAVIDYGMGNLHSIAKALQHAAPDSHVTVTGDPSALRQAARIVLPGVGAIRDCMDALNARGLISVIAEMAARKPVLGICLGMQAMLEASDENGGTPCLGLLGGRVLRFREGLRDSAGNALKIPHMGWNRLNPAFAHPLWEGIEAGSWFYFVHSYYASPDDPAHVAATSDYPEPFAAALLHGNLFAVQFHPEKSQAAGLRLLANFLRWEPGK